MGSTHPAPQSRRRRWLFAGAVLAVLLAVYAGALIWFTQRVQSGVERSLRDAPVVEDYQHRSD